MGTAVYVIRRHYCINQLHESGWSLFISVIRFRFTAMGSIFTAANVGLFVRFDRMRCFANVEVCVSTLEKLPMSPLAQETMVVLECGTL